MIKVGDIVYRLRRGGFIHEKPIPITDSIGLVIKEYKQKGAIPQYYVQFDQESPKWYYQHDIRRVYRHNKGTEKND